MYTRRKVFSIGEDYDLYQSLYSEAFDEGAEYAERLFAEQEAERNYSDGFDDGFYAAIQRMYSWNNEKERNLYNKLIKKGMKKEEAVEAVLATRSQEEVQNINNLRKARKEASKVTDPLALKAQNPGLYYKKLAGSSMKGKKEVEQSLKKWKIGAGAAGLAGLAGLGYGIYKGTRKDED